MDWILELVIKWFIGYVAKVGKTIPWDSMAQKLKDAVDFLPDFFEVGVEEAIDGAVAALKAVFDDEANLSQLIAAVVAQDWPRVLKELEELLSGKEGLHPQVAPLKETAGRMKAKALAKAA